MSATNGNGNGADKVVVIGGNTTDMHLYRYLFEKSDYELFYFATYTDAIDFINNTNPVCIVVDFLLEDTGANTLKIIDILSQEHAVVVISDHHDPKDIKKAMEVGAYDYLPKQNLTLELLERTIRIAVRGKNVRDELENITQTVNSLRHSVKVNFVKLNEETSRIQNTLKQIDKKIADQQGYFNDMNQAILVELRSQMDKNRELITASSCKTPSNPAEGE